MPFSTVQTKDVPAPRPSNTHKPREHRAPIQRRVKAVPKGTPQWMCVPARALKRGDTTVDKTMLKEWRDYVISVDVKGGTVVVVWMTPELNTWKGNYGAADIMEIWRVKA